MAIFEVGEQLKSKEAKELALKNLRALVQSYQDRRNPLDGANEPALQQLSEKWNHALLALSELVAEQPGTDDATLWDQLFFDERLATWESNYQNDLIPLQEWVASYESGTMTDQLTDTVKVKKWNLGSVLCELQEEFAGIVQSAQGYDKEMTKVQSEVTAYTGIDSALTREISFDSEERGKNKGEKPEKFSEAAIINLSKIENYTEFTKEYGNIAELSGEFGNLLQMRLQEIEKGESNKKYVDYQQAVLEYVNPRIAQLQVGLVETTGTKEMTAIREAETAVAAAEEDLKAKQEGVENSKKAYEDAKKAVEKGIKDTEKTYADEYKAEEDEINNKLSALSEERKNEQIREATKAAKETKEKLEQGIAALEKEKENPNSTFWADRQGELSKIRQDDVYNKLAADTMMYKNGGLKNLHDVDEEIKNEADIAYREALPKWQNEVNDLMSDLQKQEKLETQSIAKSMAQKINELEEQKEKLARGLSEWKESNKITADELEKSKNEYAGLKNNEKNRAEIVQKQLKAFADQKSMLLENRKLAQKAEKDKKIKGFSGEWRGLLDRTKEDYAQNAPAFLAAEAAKDMLEKVEKELAEETEINLREMTLADYSNPDKLARMKKEYCERYKEDKERYEAKGKEFDSKINMRRGSLEKLVKLTSSAYKLYTRIDENLDDRFAKSKAFDQKYGPIAVKKAANDNEVSSNMKRDEKRTVAQLKEDILRYRENAQTLMYGARVYELKKKKDTGNLALWEAQLDTKENEDFQKEINNITVAQNNTLEEFDRKQRRQEELLDQIKKLEEANAEETRKIKEYTADSEAVDTELNQQTKQFEEIQAWWQQVANKDQPDVVGAAVEKLAGYRKDGGKSIESMRANAAKLKETVSKEPKKETMSTKKLDHLRKIRADFEQKLAEAKEADRKESFDKYIQQEKDRLEAYKKENSDEKIAEEITNRFKKEKDALTLQKDNLQRKKNIDVEVAGKDLLKAEDNVKKAEELQKESEEALDARRKELEDRKTEGASMVDKCNSIKGLIELYGKEAQLIPNLKDVTEESNGRFKIINDVEGLKADYDKVVSAGNERLEGIKEELSGKMLKPEADRILGGVETFLKTADVGRADKKKENSDEYKDMNNALKNYAAKAKRNELKTPESIAEELRTIKQFAQTYIQKKQDQFGHKVLGYYSNQAKVRLDYAQRLIDFCDNGIKKVEQVEPQVDAMKRSIEGQKRQPYSTTAEFFDGYVRSTLNKREDIGQLNKENEFKVRKDKQLLEMKDLKEKNPEAYEEYKKGLENAFNKQLRENKGPFTFRTVTDTAKVKQWIEQYQKLNTDRKKLEETAGIDKIFNKANVNAKNIPNKGIDPLAKGNNNPIVMQ